MDSSWAIAAAPTSSAPSSLPASETTDEPLTRSGWNCAAPPDRLPAAARSAQPGAPVGGPHMSSLAEANLTRRKVVAAGIAGNVMEWYDFAVYGYFARTIGNLYFPTDDPDASLLAAFAVFAVGFLMRPLGAVLFGYIGDRVGRGPALLWSVVAMAAPTFVIGLL